MSSSVSGTVQFSMAGVDLSTADVTPTDTQTVANLAAAVAARLPIGGGTLTGPLTLQADPTTSLQAATKHYVDTSSAAGMPVTGATMTGPLMLSSSPAVALQAAPKQYVDAQVSTALPLSGGTLTGPLTTMSTGTSTTAGNNVGTFDGFAEQFSFRRQITSGTPGQPTVYVGLTNFSSSYTSYYSSGEYIDVPAMVIQAQNVPGSTGQLNGLQILMNSGGNNPFDSEDQGLNVQVTKSGQNSTWAINTQSLDTTGLPPQPFATIGAEIDLGGSGYDNAASAYDPYQSYRATMWFNGRPYPWSNWTASTAYAAGAVVTGTPSGGVLSTYIARNAGTSGKATPNWSSNAGATVADNGITWALGTTYAFSIGRGIWFDSNLGTNQFEWGTCISGDAIVQNAFLDTQRVSFADGSGAAIRLAANQPIDFTGNLTQAGKNQHTLTYGSTLKQLVYAVGGQAAFAINDSFAVKMFGPASLACGAQGSLSGVAAGYSPQGLTVGWSYAGTGETDFMVAASGLNIYPVSAAGATPASPIFTLNGSGNLKACGSLTAGTSLAVGSTLAVAGVAGLAVTGSGSLHGVTTGFSPQGLTVGWSYANAGETDLLVSVDGLNVYTVSASGVASSTPIFALSGTGNLALPGNVSASGSLTAGTSLAVGSTLAVAGVAGLAVTGAGSLHGVTTGFSPQGLTVGWSYANTGETDLMVSVDGLNVYTVNASGVASSTPIFAVSGAGNVSLPALKAATSYANDAAAATGGVAVGQLYRNGSNIQMRIS